MIDICSPFQFDSFVNNDHYLVTLFTPIYIFSQKSGNSTKKNIILSKPSHYHHASTSPGLGFSSMMMVVKRSPLLKLLFPVSFPDCVLRGGTGDEAQGLNVATLPLVSEF